MFEITHRERVGWQRRAATHLTEILAAHRDLPLLAWTVSNAGATLVGHVNSLGPAEEVRAVFDVWCDVLAADRRAERLSLGGSVYLWATAETGRVKVNLTATVFPGEGEE
jgi:hypothetical protein